jgi:tRNA A37 threonylcarbamoyladenosine dehydratase
MSKAMLTKQVVESLCPSLTVDAHQAFYHHDTADQLLATPLDYVIDAIDSFTPKVALLERCVQQNLPVVSCMGASSRTDPTALRIADIFETTECPLARAVRRGLRRKGIYHGITAVFSVERARPPLPADASEDVLQRGRVRHRQPSLIAMPGIFGYAAANVVIKSLSELTGPK